MKTIRIGNGAGFWGDNLDAPRRLAESGRLDYLTLEYLAELTLSILALQKRRDPERGYVTDFPTVIESLLPELQRQPSLKIVTNAGGMNPESCARRIAEILKQSGHDDIRLASVTGDDLLPRVDELRAAGEKFANFETGRPLADRAERLAGANAYLGAQAIADALDADARIVITGRVADASLCVGPAMHEFSWSWDNWEKLAAASVAGHLIECGAQVTGGMYSDWNSSIRLNDIGYPVAELTSVGTVCLTKPAGTGGIVSTATVAEQLVYEIGDPAHYLTPDVDVDFTHITLSEDGPDRVCVWGARGNPRPDRYKASLSYEDGYSVAGTLLVVGRRAEERARESARIIFDRVQQAGVFLGHTHVECLGTGDSLPGIWPRFRHTPEVVLRISAHDHSHEALERLTREFAPLVTSGPPGITGYTGGRPKPHRVLAYWPSSIARTHISPHVDVRSAKEWLT